MRSASGWFAAGTSAFAADAGNLEKRLIASVQFRPVVCPVEKASKVYSLGCRST
jgi:hypothetical protein